MFYLIGLGMGNSEDITGKGSRIIKKCDRIYLEYYTSIMGCPIAELEEFCGQKLIIADRELVEEQADSILEGADEKNIALLVAGNPFVSTTHMDLILRADEKNIEVEIVGNDGIMQAVARCGLLLYNFGEQASIPFWTDTWKPDSFFDRILGNYKRNCHTLCLLDIKVKEPTLESLTKKKREYMPARFMSVKEASSQLLEIIESRKDNEAGISKDSLCFGLARLSNPDQKIVFCSLEKMATVDLGAPLHCMVIAAPTLHPMELKFAEKFRI